MDNCTYNKIKLLHELSKVAGFIERYARKDSRLAKHKDCEKVIHHLHQDLQTHIKQLHQQLSKKGL